MKSFLDKSIITTALCCYSFAGSSSSADTLLLGFVVVRDGIRQQALQLLDFLHIPRSLFFKISRLLCHEFVELAARRLGREGDDVAARIGNDLGLPG